MLKDSSCQGHMWKALFQERRAVLGVTAEMLSQNHGSTERVLSEALLAIEGTPFCGRFAQRSATRAVVKAALANNNGIQHSSSELLPAGSILDGLIENWPLEKLPWAERVAYYLRHVLCYSRRDSALLLGIGDAHLDELSARAERRIAAWDRPADRSPAMPGGMVRGADRRYFGRPVLTVMLDPKT